MSIPIIDTIDWTTPRLPSDLVDYVTAASLSESVQPLTNRSAYLRNILETTGIRRVQTLADVAALRAVEATEGDVAKVDNLGLFVFVPGAAPPMQPTDFTPWWVRTTNPVTVEGRWENVAMYATQMELGKVEGAIPVLDADGRLTVTPPNAIVGIYRLGRQAASTLTSVDGVINGLLSLGSLKQNDWLRVTGSMTAQVQGGTTLEVRPILYLNGVDTSIGSVYQGSAASGATYTTCALPLCCSYQLGADASGATLKIFVVRGLGATLDTNAFINDLCVEVIRP